MRARHDRVAQAVDKNRVLGALLARNFGAPFL